MSARRLTKDEVLRIHEVAIARFGGLDGVRDEGMLESALAQPHMTFDGIELYPSLEEGPPDQVALFPVPRHVYEFDVLYGSTAAFGSSATAIGRQLRLSSCSTSNSSWGK